MKKVLAVILAAALLLCAFPASAFAVTADVPEGALQYKIRITDNFGWGKAFLYAWDADGNDIFAAYPGKEIEAKGINEYGENYFEITLPHNTEGFIIDNGNDNRTVEIRDFKDYDGYWMDGTEDAYGHYYVTGYNDNPVDNTDPDGCTEPDYTYEIVITNSLDWEDFYVYAWTYSGEDIFGEWPGTKLFNTNLKNGYGHDVFVFYLPEDTYGFIVSNGKGEQSQDVTDLGEHDYYFTGEKDDFGNYYVDTPQCTCGLTEPTTAPKPDGYRYVVVTNNFGWEKLYVYTWDEKDQPIEAAWPGVEYTKKYANDYGEELFVCKIPDNAKGFIFNDGQGMQSQDIYDTSSEGFWFSDNKDEYGHFECNGFYDVREYYEINALPPEEDKSDKVVKITDNFNWGKAYVFAWDDDGNELFESWPGKELEVKGMNEFGENYFEITVPYNASGFIINDGNGNQTVEVTDYKDCDGYWMDGTKDERGYYNVTGYTDKPVDNTDPEWKEDYYSFYNSLGFEDVYIYAYDNDGVPLMGEWPGTALTDYQTEYNMERYVLNIPEGAKGYIIHDNKGRQTEDIEDFTLYSFWLDGTKNDKGHFVVTQFIPQPTTPSSPTAPASQPECTEPEYTYDIRFINSLDWENFYVYAWNENGEAIFGEWPGTKLSKTDLKNEYGQEFFVLYLPEDTCGFIVNNGNGEQSVDITYLYEIEYYLTGEKNDLGHYYVDSPKCTCGLTEPTTGQNEDGSHYVYFTNNHNWDKVYVYSWDEDGNSLSDFWPGNEVVNKTTNGYGEEIFLCEIPNNAAGMVFNNGKGVQSEDVYDTWKTGYWLTDEINDLGYYIVDAFYGDTDPTSGTVPSPGEMRKKGDINGDGIVSVADATLVQQHAAEMITLEGEALSAADTNGDGIVSVADATLIQQFAAEIIDKL